MSDIFSWSRCASFLSSAFPPFRPKTKANQPTCVFHLLYSIITLETHNARFIFFFAFKPIQPIQHACIYHPYIQLSFSLFFFLFFFFLISYLVFTFYFLFACVTISSQKVYACNLYFFLLVLVIGYYCTTNDFFYTHSSLPFYYFSFINSVCLLKFCTYLRVYFSHTFFPVVFHLFDILSIFLIHS